MRLMTRRATCSRPYVQNDLAMSRVTINFHKGMVFQKCPFTFRPKVSTGQDPPPHLIRFAYAVGRTF
jgi:hypothetical protein